jgi:hypothetical protein
MTIREAADAPPLGLKIYSDGSSDRSAQEPVSAIGGFDIVIPASSQPTRIRFEARHPADKPADRPGLIQVRTDAGIVLTADLTVDGPSAAVSTLRTRGRRLS